MTILCPNCEMALLHKVVKGKVQDGPCWQCIYCGYEEERGDEMEYFCEECGRHFACSQPLPEGKRLCDKCDKMFVLSERADDPDREE